LESWLKSEGLRDRVQYLGYVSDDDLVALYNLADVFVYPSIYEGFGLPVLEAMSCGAPVITSNVTSLPEIAGDAALLVDPRNTRELAEALKRILREPALREEMVERGFQQIRKFSWRTAAEETIHLFAKAIA
jgi:glycosyltransferase involved in cell wall biosynthesis